MDEKTLPGVPSSWEEGLGVVEKNNDITYYKSYVYEMVEPFLSLPPSLRSPHRSLLALRHPCPLLPEGDWGL